MKRAMFLTGLAAALALRLLPLSAQEPEFAAGLIFDDEAYESAPRLSAESGAKADLPAAIDLSAYCPEVRHQGYIFSCVGWATGYGALSAQRAILNRCTDKEVINRNAHSALFLYNQVKKGDCRQGARISDALEFLQKNGDCLAGQFDFDVNNCEQTPDDRIASAARRFTIADYMTLLGFDDAADHKTLLTKQALAAGMPVVVGMNVLHNFYELRNALHWHPAIGNTTPAGGHAMVVVGYDDRKGAFRLMSSWGKNWGDQGFIWIKYADFGRYCKYAYIMLLTPAQAASMQATGMPDEAPVKSLVRFGGEVELLVFTGWSEQSRQALFEPVGVELRQGRYETAEQAVGQRFQLRVRHVTPGVYLYVFSVSPDGAARVHWPRSEVLDARFAGQNETALIVSSEAEIIVPGPGKVLTASESGLEQLVILFSSQKIETFGTFAAIAAPMPGDLHQNVLKTLGEYAVPEADLQRQVGRMALEAATRSEGFIASLVLIAPIR